MAAFQFGAVGLSLQRQWQQGLAAIVWWFCCVMAVLVGSVVVWAAWAGPWSLWMRDGAGVELAAGAQLKLEAPERPTAELANSMHPSILLSTGWDRALVLQRIESTARQAGVRVATVQVREEPAAADHLGGLQFQQVWVGPYMNVVQMLTELQQRHPGAQLLTLRMQHEGAAASGGAIAAPATLAASPVMVEAQLSWVLRTRPVLDAGLMAGSELRGKGR